MRSALRGGFLDGKELLGAFTGHIHLVGVTDEIVVRAGHVLPGIEGFLIDPCQLLDLCSGDDWFQPVMGLVIHQDVIGLRRAVIAYKLVPIYAGTIVEGRADTTAEKIKRMKAAGIAVAERISDIPKLLAERIGEAS